MRNVIVTGGSRGLGLAVCRTLAEAGYHVIALARTRGSEFDAVAEQAGAITFEPCDLSDVAAIATTVRAIRKRHGAPFGLVNNAGLGTEGLLATMHVSQIEALVRLNTLAPIVLTKYVVRAMMAEGAGRVVNMSSIIASTGFSGLAAYGATKASLVGFTKSLAREVGSLGITVNAVAPGFIDTELTGSMTPEDRARIARRGALRRLAEPQDVAAAVAFLMSDAARNITGTVLTVDAGGTA